MNWITNHPGITYFTVTILEVVTLIIIAGALISIAKSLKDKKEER